jgi:hypothetical protein
MDRPLSGSSPTTGSRSDLDAGLSIGHPQNARPFDRNGTSNLFRGRTKRLERSSAAVPLTDDPVDVRPELVEVGVPVARMPR